MRQYITHIFDKSIFLTWRRKQNKTHKEFNYNYEVYKEHCLMRQYNIEVFDKSIFLTWRTKQIKATETNVILQYKTSWKWQGNVLFNNALNTYNLRLYGIIHMVKDHSDSERGNPLLPHGQFFPINSKGSFICTIHRQDSTYPRPL